MIYLKKLSPFQLTENSLLLGLAVIVGIGTGAAVFLFRESIELSHRIFQEWLAEDVLSTWFGEWSVPLALALAGVVVGLIVTFAIRHERHHGVAGIIASVTLLGGRLPYAKIPFKALVSAITLGAGASTGPEDPSVQIGANLGSFLGQYLHLTEERVRLLVASGAASAIAAAFNAPIAGVFFALEIILGDFAASSVGVVVLAAVMSAVFTESIGHGGAEFGIRNYHLGGPVEVPFYILLGLIAAPIAALFIRMVYWQKHLWEGWKIPAPAKTAIAGFIVGSIGIFYPEVLGIGRESLNEVLNTGAGDFTIQLLIFLFVLKMIATSITLGGGFVGGTFAPALFVGAMMGGAYGRILEQFFPSLDRGDPAAYAIAGMAAVMTGVLRAPITTILLIFELTHDYQLILPIMLTTVVTILAVERLEPFGIYTKALRNSGLVIQQGRDVDVMQSVFVQEVMESPSPSIAASASLQTLRDTLRAHNIRAICVVEDHAPEKLAGMVTLADLQAAYENRQTDSDSNPLTVGDICTRQNIISITPNEPVFAAIQKMGRYGFAKLPVVAADDPTQLLGTVRRHDVMRSYNLAITRKWESQDIQNQIRLNNLVDEKVLLFHISEGAPIHGKQIRDIEWPKNSLVAAIRRQGKTIMPHGDTPIYAGDRLTIVAEPDSEEALNALLAGSAG